LGKKCSGFVIRQNLTDIEIFLQRQIDTINEQTKELVATDIELNDDKENAVKLIYDELFEGKQKLEKYVKSVKMNSENWS
jgi:hypothetical protein